MLREKVDATFGIDLRSLAAFRIALGCVLLLDLVLRAWFMEAHYTDAGVLPLASLYKNYWGPTHWSVHALSGDLPLQVGLFLLQGALTIGMIVGWNTRWTVFGCWFLLTSLQTRNQMVLQGGDDLLRMLVFWSVFLPMGERWSLDARERQGRPADRVVSIASTALLLQVCLMYWCTAYLKWAPSWWDQGAAIEMALRLDAYATIPGKLLLMTGQLPLKLMTWAVLILEYVGPLAALFAGGWKWPRLRVLTVIAFWFLHLGIGATLEVGLFWITSMVCWIPFLPAWFWDHLPRKFPRLRSSHGRGTLRGEHPFVDLFVASVMFYILLWSLRTLDGRANYKNMLQVFPTTYNPIGYGLRVDQYWSMFAPGPPSRDGWYVVPATLEDGSEVDLYAMSETVSYDKPDLVVRTFDGQRWRKFLFNMPDQKHHVLRPDYARWLKLRWERAHPAGPRVRKVELVLMVETTQLHGELPPKRTSLGTYTFP